MRFPPETSDLDAYLRNFQLRVIQDAVAEATPYYWLRRASTFDAVGPRCAAVARACRQRALVDQIETLSDAELCALAADVRREA